MATERFVVTQRNPSTSSLFWFRLTDNFFRRLPLYLLPVLLLTAVGVKRSTSTADEYQSSGTLSVSTNPLVASTSVRGATIYNWETPAAGTQRIILEQMTTDTFAEKVARDAGVGPALESGLVTLDLMRQSIVIAAAGDTLLSISSTWADPKTAYQLVSSTINAYVEFVNTTEVSDSLAAVDFYTEVGDSAKAQSLVAQQALDEYLMGHPEPLNPDVGRPIEEELRIQRLNDAISTAEDAVFEAQSGVQTAQLQIEQANSEAGQRVRVVDAPEMATAPESTRTKQVMTIGVFFVLGLAVAAAALLLATLADRSVRSAADISAIGGGLSVVATIPVVSALRRNSRSGGKRRRSTAKAPAKPKRSRRLPAETVA